MADIDIKALTPGAAAASSIIMGAANTAAASPSLFTTSGSGSVVLTTSPTLVTPNLGTPSALTLTNATGLPIAGVTGWGTGVATALAIAIGSAGAPVLFNGAGGTPSSLTLTNATGLPVGGIAAIAANTFVANGTGGSASPTALSAASATALLSVMVGDSGSGGVKGLVPAPAAGDAAAGKFLKADGTYAVPPGGSGGSPGGSSGQLQYNNAGAFGGMSGTAWDDTNRALTITGATVAGTALTNVAITGTGGQFSCDAANLSVGELVTISGTLGGTGSITGYSSPSTYRIIATNGSTTFTLGNNVTGAALTTTAGTPTGLTYVFTSPLIDLTQTWNNTNVAFTGLRFNVTDTASNALALLLDLQVSGVTKFRVDKSGNVGIGGANTSTTYACNVTGSVGASVSVVAAADAATFIMGASRDSVISRPAARTWQFGVADANTAPPAMTLRVQSGSGGTNLAGADWTIQGSAGTGTGAGGSIIFQVAPASTSSSVKNSYVTALTLASTGTVLASRPLGGLGYATGAGGAVTQITSRTTGVTLNNVCGAITLVSAAGSATWQTFTVTNSVVSETDVVVVSQKSGTDKYMINVTAVGAGSFDISFATTGGTTTEQPVFNFAVLHAVAA